MSQFNQLDAHQRPPDRLRSLFKKYQKCKAEDLHSDLDVIDMSRTPDEFDDQLRSVPKRRIVDRDRAFEEFLSSPPYKCGDDKAAYIPTFELRSIPGLYILPDLLCPEVQLSLLNRLLHRDLSNPDHRTNIHLHHEISYPPTSSHLPECSFFLQNKAATFAAKDPAMHKSITVAEFLRKKLRWMTLGGQYDWTAKTYPPEDPPAFPADIKQLLKSLFPATDAQAAIVNFYSAGDTLSIHRDVSEHCDHGLVSVSIGCDGLFIVGSQDGVETATIRLKSGDAVYMTGASRYAWHGVPKIIPDTCPEWLAGWPAADNSETEYNTWRGWMNDKRVNLNVRQMTERSSSS